MIVEGSVHCIALPKYENNVEYVNILFPSENLHNFSHTYFFFSSINLLFILQYSFYYIISSLSEWAFTFFSILFIATFYREFKHMKLKLKLQPKPISQCSIDSVQMPVHTTFNGHDEVTKM